MFTRLFGATRQATRTLLRSPSFTAVSVLTLALGIGATTAIFSLVYGVVIQGLPYEAADRLVIVDHKAPGVGFERGLGAASGLYWHYLQRGALFESLSYWETYEVTVTGDDTEPMRVPVAETTASLFSQLGVRPLHGRLFDAEDDDADGPRAVLLTYTFWQRYFGGDPDAVGQDLMVTGRARPIVGILPAGFRFAGADLWLDNTEDFADNFGGFNGTMIARIEPGVSVEALRAELDRQIADVGLTYDLPGLDTFVRDSEVAALPLPLKEWLIGPVGQVLWILMGTVGLVMLIACANVANLFLVRAEARQREVAVRYALGASWGQVLRGFLAESLLLSLAGCALGIVVAQVATQALLARVPFTLPRIEDVGLNAAVLAFAIGMSLLSGIVFGSLPVMRRRLSLNDSLRDGSRSSTVGKARVRTRQGLVVAQIALSLVLLSGAGLMGRSFTRLAAVDLGFTPDNLLTFQLSLPSAQYPEYDDAAAFHDAMIERLRALPGVTAVGAVRDLPLSGRSGGDVMYRRSDMPGDGEVAPVVWVTRATPTYFATAGMTLVRGRGLERADRDAERPTVVLNQAAVDVFFGDDDPIGEEVHVGMDETTAREWLEVVGVVATTKRTSLAESPTPMVYINLTTGSFNSARLMSYVVRVDGPPMSIAEGVRNTVRLADRNLPIIQLRPMEQIVTAAEAPMAFTMVMLGLAASVAIVLGSIGVYGVISYIVGNRTAEIGIRMALGAAGRDVRRMLMRQGLAVALGGLAAGLVGALLLARTVESQLYAVDPFDPATHVTTSLTLVAVVLLATWVPAWRASRIDPNVALRSD